MLIAVVEISNYGLEARYFIIGGLVGMLGTILLFIYAEVRGKDGEDDDG